MKRLLLAVAASLVLTDPLAAQPVYLKGSPTPIPATPDPATNVPEYLLNLEPEDIGDLPPPRYFGRRTGKSRWADGPAMDRDRDYGSPPVFSAPSAQPAASATNSIVARETNSGPLLELLAPANSGSTASPTPAAVTGPRHTAPVESAMPDELTQLRGNAAKEFFWSQMRAHRPVAPATLLLSAPVTTGK